MTTAYAIHWFRRDLRVAGNPALQQSWKDFNGRVLGLFCFDRQFLARPDFSINRFGFFLQTLRTLREELRALGGDLLVLDVGPREAMQQLWHALADRQISLPARVSFNRDYEPYARQRDATMSEWLARDCGITVQHERDHLLFEPDEIGRDAGGMFQVYSPFARRWFAKLAGEVGRERLAEQTRGLHYLEERASGHTPQALKLTWEMLWGGPSPLADSLDEFIATIQPRVTVPLPPTGSLAGLARARLFGQQAMQQYHERRDFPGVDGTSQLSIYLKNGSITGSQVLAALQLGGETFEQKTGPGTFVREIAWREFYYHVLYHRPDVEHGAFLERYRNLAWENREDWFAAWKEGQTGYPIVDAGMRQLRDTGWMHNRVRMIVASFLTKDLLIDWRWGERYFMETLLDGDLAPNNGGWQWAASTGCDPQPYFRIFNPRLQSEKFDPVGEYIRRYVPELEHLSAKAIHAPGSARPRHYPAPIVDHAEQKERALSLYRSASSS